jgi:hypothetical protein
MMKIEGDYEQDGYAFVRGLIAPEIARVFLAQLQADLAAQRVPYSQFAAQSKLLNKVAVEIYGYRYKPMVPFLWGLTPTMCEITGRDLLPTYNFFRLYQGGDICRVHSDRPACEHSLSLTLAYGDDKVWNLDIGKAPVDEPKSFAEDFGGEEYSSLGMEPGDAVLYRGTDRRHGRINPNPNRWSAHMFLHWVDRGGPHAATAFDGMVEIPEKIEFL